MSRPVCRPAFRRIRAQAITYRGRVIDGRAADGGISVREFRRCGPSLEPRGGGTDGHRDVQLPSMAGSPLGGWLGDILHRRTASGRMIVQAGGVLGGAPFVLVCGLKHSTLWLVVALTASVWRGLL